jgi:hypothetical protein
MSDVKNLPHYTQFKFQPIDFIRANKDLLDFMQANVIKYVCRYKLKNGKEDLLKARNYLDMLIEECDLEEKERLAAVARHERPLCSSECTGRCAACSPYEARRF